MRFEPMDAFDRADGAGGDGGAVCPSLRRWRSPDGPYLRSSSALGLKFEPTGYQTGIDAHVATSRTERFTRIGTDAPDMTFQVATGESREP